MDVTYNIQKENWNLHKKFFHLVTLFKISSSQLPAPRHRILVSPELLFKVSIIQERLTIP